MARIRSFGSARLTKVHRPATNQAQDVYDLALVLREVGGDHLPPRLTDLIDAAAAHPSVRPSVFDVLHELHAMSGPPGVWLAAAEYRPTSVTPSDAATISAGSASRR